MYKADRYYVQDSRQYVGNCVLWWAKDRNGYTCDLDRAHVFTAAEIEGETWRDTDIPWPQGIVDHAVRRHCDKQGLPLRSSLVDEVCRTMENQR